MNRQELLREIKARLTPVYGGRLRGVVLYGSEARGEAEPDSDIDVLILLEGGAQTWQDVRAAGDALYDLMLKIGRTIDAMPVDARRYEEAEAPLYIEARREGIRA